jgi:preprotein translocase subunit SecY
MMRVRTAMPVRAVMPERAVGPFGPWPLGAAGQATITQYTRYLTMGLAVIISAGYVELARTGNLFPGTDCSAASHPLIPDPSVLTIATMMITMVAGTAVIMWMGELITDRGGQALYSGVSLLIMVGVGLDTVKQIESQLRQHRYEGFLRRPVRPAGKVHGTSDAPAALTVS